MYKECVPLRGAAWETVMLCWVQVVVLEKGGFTPAADLSLSERQSFREMYEMGSFLTTQDAGAALTRTVRGLKRHSCMLARVLHEALLPQCLPHCRVVDVWNVLCWTCRFHANGSHPPFSI